VCLEILGQSHRHQRVAALLTPDATDSDFWNARVVARDLGIDTFEVTLRRIGQNSACRSRRSPAVQTARSVLGRSGKAHDALDWSLQALRDHPGIGGDLLTIGLQSPVTRNRNMALNAFQQWPAESWPSEAGRVLRGEPSE
jgi:hypothetical protein